MARRDDRWLTPAVVVVLILAGTVVCLGVLLAITYLTARGYDPQPVLQLTGTLAAALAAAGNFVLTLMQRRTTTKVERETGRLASGVEVVVDELDAARGRHAPLDDAVPIPGRRTPPPPLVGDETRPHPIYGGQGVAPAPGRR